MGTFKVERNGIIRDDRGHRKGEIDKNYLRDERGHRIAEIQGDKIRDSHGHSIGYISGSIIRDSHGHSVGDIKKIPIKFEMPVSPAMAAAIMHFFITPMLK